ncbi:MAG TPA: hypothetical protein VHM19_02885, partial [Polyangiales bacterium]|nr:hypothetical protein [Polyangiales bacterium]
MLLALVTPLGFLGGVWWVLDLFGQFHVYYAVFAALLIPIALWQDARSGAALACLVLIINLVLIAPFYLASH